MKTILIIQCPDPLMWYSDKVGKEVPFIRETFTDYVSIEDKGFTNIVKKEDAIILNQN